MRRPGSSRRGDRTEVGLRAAATLLAGVVAMLAATSCERPATSPHESDLIMALHDSQVTLEDFHDWVDENVPSPSYETLSASAKSRLLDQMLEEVILLQAAATRGIEVDAVEVDAWLEQWGEAGKARDEEFRREVRRRLMIKRFREEKLLADLEYTDEDLRGWYEDHELDYLAPTRFKVRHIFLSEEERVLRARELLEEGRAFEEVAEELNQAPLGGQTHWVEKDELPKVLREALSGLEPNEWTNVLRTPEGYHILELEELSTGGPRPFEEVEEAVEKDYLRHLSDRRIEQTIQNVTSREPFVFMPENLDFEYVP